jgi:purine-nucleoside phosphorylase
MLRTQHFRCRSIIAKIQFACLAALFSVVHSCGVQADDFKVLEAYTRYADTAAVNNPTDYISWLKQQPRFRDGKLDNLPDAAIILYSVDVRSILNSLGFPDTEIEEIPTGHTTPNVIFVVKRSSGSGFIVNRGMPGAGGVSTQIAELAALGVKKVIHIGTCGLLGQNVPYASLIISTGSYKDGAAFLLSPSRAEAAEQIAYPDTVLSSEIEKQLIASDVRHTRALGFTSPVYYFQKTGLLKTLLNLNFDRNMPPPDFVEMEQASFFVTARLANVRAASIVIGSDRAVLAADSIKQQFFEGSTDPFLILAVRHAVAVLTSQP